MQTSNEMEHVQNRITSLFQDPLCKILMKKSFFTEIQVETLLIDFLTYQTTETRVTQTSKALSRQKAKGRTRGSYNRVLQQSRIKLEKTLCSMLLLGYLGILGNVASSTFTETSQKMQEYLEMRHRQPIKTESNLKRKENQEEGSEAETQLIRQLYQLLTGTKPMTP